MPAEYDETTSDYIEYYMWRHGANMSVKDIARELGVKWSTIYHTACKYGIKVKRINDHDPDLCKQRPQGCFRCTASECRFAGACSSSEAAYLYAGIDNEGKTRKKYQ